MHQRLIIVQRVWYTSSTSWGTQDAACHVIVMTTHRRAIVGHSAVSLDIVVTCKPHGVNLIGTSITVTCKPHGVNLIGMLITVTCKPHGVKLIDTSITVTCKPHGVNLIDTLIFRNKPQKALDM